jgi:hypothetical protein
VAAATYSEVISAEDANGHEVAHESLEAQAMPMLRKRSSASRSEGTATAEAGREKLKQMSGRLLGWFGVFAVGALLIGMPASGAATKISLETCDISSPICPATTVSVGVLPHSLPRSGTAPVKIGIDASIGGGPEEGSGYPTSFELIADPLVVFDAGEIPRCRQSELRAAAPGACRSAIVGEGALDIRTSAGRQLAEPLKIFNRGSSGATTNLVVYARIPLYPAFVEPLKITVSDDGSIARMRFPKPARLGATITGFRMILGNRLVSAGCPRGSLNFSAGIGTVGVPAVSFLASAPCRPKD